MHVGYAPLFQNPGKALSDAEVYREELRPADRAEPSGFESLWSVEHHFTDYTMCPDALQFLTYMADDPIRVAEPISLLDHQSGGRRILGLGRGLARGGFFFVDESADRAEEMAMRYIGGYYHSVMAHDEMRGEHFGAARGYEFYRSVNKHIRKGVPYDAAEGNMRLFASQVLPELRSWARGAEP